MGIVTKIGNWLDKRFPEKMPVEDVIEKYRAYDREMTNVHVAIEALQISLVHVSRMEAELERLKSDLEKIKAISVIKSRVPPPYKGTMEPSWLPPVMPSPQK